MLCRRRRRSRKTVSVLLLALLVVVLVRPSVPAAEPEAGKAGDAMFEKYLAERTARLSERFLVGDEQLVGCHRL